MSEVKQLFQGHSYIFPFGVLPLTLWLTVQQLIMKLSQSPAAFIAIMSTADPDSWIPAAKCKVGW